MMNLEKNGVPKDSVYEELQQVFNHLPKYHIKILLGAFNAKVGRENIFKLTIWNGSLHQYSSDNGVRILNFDTSKICLVGRACRSGQVNVYWLVCYIFVV